MLSRKSDQAAVSEIIGALMLVLIVVVAASSFAVFISEEQKNAQAQQLANQQRELESIDAISLTPIADVADQNRWDMLTFNIANLETAQTFITYFSLNGEAVQAYEINGSGDSSWTNMNMGEDLILGPLEQVQVRVDVSQTNWSSGKPSIDASTPFLVTDYIKIDIFTSKLNDFSKTFVPPTALGVIDTETQWDAATDEYESFLILDGTQSMAFGNSTYIVSWSWSIVNSTVNENIQLSGSKVRLDLLNSNFNSTITLTVTDSNGMIGTCSFVYYAGPGTDVQIASIAPPSAIPMVTTDMQWNASTDSYTPFIILDGTQSSVGTGAYLTSWNWKVVNSTGTYQLTGPKVRFDFYGTGIYTITLTVTDDLKRTASETISYDY